MTTLQEAYDMIDRVLRNTLYDDDYAEHSAALDLLSSSALAQQGAPAAYITPTEQGPMVWTPEMYGEACTYCDDGEFPVPLFTRPMPAQDVTELVEALEKLARLGNGEHYGNSDGNMIARTALSKYKGAK